MMPLVTVIVFDPLSTVKDPVAPFPAESDAPEISPLDVIGPAVVAPPVPLPVMDPDTTRSPSTVEVGAVSVIPDELMTTV